MTNKCDTCTHKPERTTEEIKKHGLITLCHNCIHGDLYMDLYEEKGLSEFERWYEKYINQTEARNISLKDAWNAALDRFSSEIIKGEQFEYIDMLLTKLTFLKEAK